MTIRRRTLVLAATAAALLALSGCAAETPTTDRPAAFAAYADVVLTAPAAQDAGPSPSFAWEPVEHAASYRLSVVGADGPVWAWSGVETTVVYGGYASVPDPGVGALRLTAPAWWSVSAYDADGVLVAVSGQRAVSPDKTSPAALGGADSDAPADGDEPAASAPLESACELLSDDEAAEFLDAELAGPAESDADGRSLSCEWTAAGHDDLSLSVSLQAGVTPESWDKNVGAIVKADPSLPRGFEGLGDDSYMTVDWGGTWLVVYAHETYVSVRSTFTDGAEDATIELARVVIDRYAERAP